MLEWYTSWTSAIRGGRGRFAGLPVNFPRNERRFDTQQTTRDASSWSGEVRGGHGRFAGLPVNFPCNERRFKTQYNTR